MCPSLYLPLLFYIVKCYVWFLCVDDMKLPSSDRFLRQKEGTCTPMLQVEKRIQELEMYTRKEDVIISGLKIKPRSYAAAASAGVGEGDPHSNPDDQQSLETQVITFLQSKDIHLNEESISACHILPMKDTAKQPAIIMRFTNRKHKTQLLKQGKNLKGSDVFINEHLTALNAAIAAKARELRSKGKIKAT